jgi:hypothetical protein
VADEEGGEMDLLPVQLLLREGNRPRKISTRKHPNALLLLRPSRFGCGYLRRGGGGELKRYQGRTQLFPLSLPQGPMSQLDAAYEELKKDVVRPPPRERPANIWITDERGKLSTRITKPNMGGVKH